MGSNFQPVKGAPVSAVQPKRTLSLRVLILGFLVLSLYGWARLGYSLQSWYWLNFAGVHPGPAYLALTGGLWGLIGFVVSIWIYQGRAGYRLVGLAAALLMVLLYWADRIFFTRIVGAASNTLFAVLMTLFLLVYTALTLGLFSVPRRTAAIHNNQRESDVEIRAGDRG